MSSVNGVTKISSNIECDNVIIKSKGDLNNTITRLESLENNTKTISTYTDTITCPIYVTGTATFSESVNLFTFIFDVPPTTGTITFDVNYFTGMSSTSAEFTIYFTNGDYSKMESRHSGGVYTDVFRGEYDSSTLTFKLFGNNGNQLLKSFDESTLHIDMDKSSVTLEKPITTIYSDVIINAECNKESGLSVHKDRIGENNWMSLGRFSYTGNESEDIYPFISVGEGTTSFNKNKCFMMVYSKSASDGTVFGSFGFSNNDHIIKVNTDRSVRIDGNLNVNGNIQCDTINSIPILKETNIPTKYPFIPVVQSDGVMEVGRIIDFHTHVAVGEPSGTDHDCRLWWRSGRLSCDQVFTAPNISASFTVTHETGSSDTTLTPGTYCETDGTIYEQFKDNIKVDDCICNIKQATSLNNNIVGITTSIGPPKFATHGDVLIKVLPNDTYNIGDIIVPGENGYGKKGSDEEIMQCVLHRIPTAKIISLETDIPNQVACLLL